MRTWSAYASAAFATACACGARPAAAPRMPADPGVGILARASTPWRTSPGAAGDDSDESDEERGDETAIGVSFVEREPLSATGGDAYGGWLYGGLSYGAIVAGGAYTDPGPEYESVDGLTGTLEGVVSWAGAMPPRVTTACGALANPTAHVTGDRKLGGALVYVSSELATGRPWPAPSRPATVGGTINKRGCRLVPSAQIVAPAPTIAEIYGDASAASLHVFALGGSGSSGSGSGSGSDGSGSDVGPVAVQLAAGGVARARLGLGVTRIDSDDHRVSPAWLIGVITPYYAITDDNGRFRIDEMPAGTYEVTIWQAPVTTSVAGGAIVYGEPIVVRRQVQIGAKPARLDVALGGR